MSAANSKSVIVKEAVLITPSDPTPSHVLSLSTLDSQLFLRFTIEYLFVYRRRPDHHDDEFISLGDKCATAARVKSALARALVPYYPLAGRVRPKCNGLGLEVVCRAQGAVFVVASSDQYTASDFERAPKYVSQWRRFLALQVTDVLKGSPPLVVQLTWLSDGAAALGVGFSHCICDGIGSAEFLNFFAELASSTGLGGTGNRESKQTIRPAVWDRHLLDATSFKGRLENDLPAEQYHHPEFDHLPDLCRFASRFSHDQLTPTSVTFDKASLNEVKKLAAAMPSQLSESRFTSFEVLSAHIWRSWARAMNFPPTQILKLLFSVNVRKRVTPCLPAGYYGNAIVLGCAQTTVKDLTEKGLIYAVELIKGANGRVDDMYVREVVESVSQPGTCPDSVGVLILSQWSRIGLESVDFGMGRPVQLAPVCTDKYCILLPVHDQRHAIKVMLAVPTVAVDKYMYLLKNTSTRQY